ncbi:MAG: hypothetical protein KC656_14650, partial [Myxococcales bacterium]|nr:hypothetical protein [Myxococcales bacterium]
LEGAIERGLALGFDGFNAASSANIPTREGPGDVSGTMTITGQVDQGNSANKGMRLDMALVGYADVEDVPLGEDDATVQIVYATDDVSTPHLDLSLRGIPDGTLEGTLVGDFVLAGDLEGRLTLDIAFAGSLMPDGDATLREPDTTTVQGTATNAAGGVYTIDLTL